jgi:hypothetical protein
MRPPQRQGTSANGSDYEQVFIHRVHELITRGYHHLCLSAYTTQEETVITGALVEKIEGILEYPTEDWMRFYRLWCQISAQLYHTYVSKHRRTADGQQFHVYHSFLRFY